MIEVVNTPESGNPVRVISTTPREHWEGHWKRGRKYPLYSVVENNGSKFMSLTGNMKEEPYVIYNSDSNTFYAPDGWVIKEMSADSRVSSIGGAGGSDTVKYTEQSLTLEQQGQARENIGSASSSDLSGKQDTLVSGTNIKTVNGESILGVGNIIAGDPDAVKYVSQTLTSEQQAQSRTNIGAQATLVSGTSIKTINQTSLLGSGNIVIESGHDGVGFDSISTPSTPDGTAEIALSNGDTITLDLNHDHTAYPKYVLCEDENEYESITTKDPGTLYLILEEES